eukprot:g81530.t1
MGEKCQNHHASSVFRSGILSSFFPHFCELPDRESGWGGQEGKCSAQTLVKSSPRKLQLRNSTKLRSTTFTGLVIRASRLKAIISDSHRLFPLSPGGPAPCGPAPSAVAVPADRLTVQIDCCSRLVELTVPLEQLAAARSLSPSSQSTCPSLWTSFPPSST